MPKVSATPIAQKQNKLLSLHACVRARARARVCVCVCVLGSLFCDLVLGAFSSLAVVLPRELVVLLKLCCSH